MRVKLAYGERGLWVELPDANATVVEPYFVEGLDEEICQALLLPCHSIEEEVERLWKSYGPQASICVLPEGPQTIPYLEAARPLS